MSTLKYHCPLLDLSPVASKIMSGNNNQKKNAFYAQSGGVTAVINASACGVIEAIQKNSDKIGHLYAGRNGIIGALREDLIDTTQESQDAISGLRYTPSGAFGSCRYRLKDFKENKAEYKRLIEVFKAHNIGYFFYTEAVIRLIHALKFPKYLNKWAIPSKLFTYLKLWITIYLLRITVLVLALSPNTLQYLPRKLA